MFLSQYWPIVLDFVLFGIRISKHLVNKVSRTLKITCIPCNFAIWLSVQSFVHLMFPDRLICRFAVFATLVSLCCVNL
jgi:hypothetical protein